MKQSNSRWAVNLTALVLAAGLLMGLFTGCFGLMGPKNDDTGIFKVTNYGIIYGYKCTKEELPANLVIPDKIGNKVITGISRIAFYGCTGLTSIDLSGCTSLTEIGGGAFYGCSKLTGTIVFPASLTEIGWATFSGCTGLTEVKLPASLTKIGSSAFSGCTNLNRAVFANTTGWAVYDVYSNNEHAGISSTSLDNAETAARYLRETYVHNYWKKN